MSIPSLETLPVEIIHRILDNVNAETILFSFRHVCKQFYGIVDTYNRYGIDFDSMSKFDFRRLCRVIHPENVISLILCEDYTTPDLIKLFLSLVDIRQFTRLRKVTLSQFYGCDLDQILKHITNCSLISLSIDIRILWSSRNGPTVTDSLSSISAQPTLRKLDLDISYNDIKEISWPVQCSVQHLRVDNCTLNQFCMILRHFPHLRTFEIRNCYSIIGDTDSLPSVPVSFPQLTSLTLEVRHMEMDHLELLLSLTPSLVHLKLTSDEFSGYSSRWEQLIQTKLPLLEKFDFFFTTNLHTTDELAHVRSLTNPFRTPFWLEDKRCNVICDFIEHLKSRFYSMPVWKSHFEYHSDSSKVSCSNFTMMNNDRTAMDNVSVLVWDLTKVTAPVTKQKSELSSHRLFRKVTTLVLKSNGKSPPGCLYFLSTRVDLSNLVKLILCLRFDEGSIESTLAAIVILLDRACNVRSLVITDYLSYHICNISMEHVCSIVHQRVKQLDVGVKSVDDMKMVLEQLEQLSHVTFRFSNELWSHCQGIIDWLTQKGRDFTYELEGIRLSVWLGKNVIQPSKVTDVNKPL